MWVMNWKRFILRACLASVSFVGSAASCGTPADCYDVAVVARPIEQIPSVAAKCDDCLIRYWPWFVDLKIKRVVEGNIDRKSLRVLTIQHTWWTPRYGTWWLRKNSLGGFNADRGKDGRLSRCPVDAPPAAPYIKPSANDTLDDLRTAGELRYGRAPK
jgi:hypothetical protein